MPGHMSLPPTEGLPFPELHATGWALYQLYDRPVVLPYGDPMMPVLQLSKLRLREVNRLLKVIGFVPGRSRILT